MHSTLREAIDRGYRCIIAEDACAASHPDLQRPAMDMIKVEGGIFGTVANTAEIVSLLEDQLNGRKECMQ